MHVDIVVFSASDLKRRTPPSSRLSTQIFQLCRGGSTWINPELSKDLSCSRTQGSDAGDVRTRNPIDFESSTLTLRCAPKISSEQNKIGPHK